VERNQVKSPGTKPAKPRRPPSLTERVLSELREEILRGDLKPGATVNEPELAERYGVSKTPVREALRLLAQTGWVKVIPRRGYLIRPLALDDIREIFALRRMVEPPLAASSARRADAAGIAALQELVAIQANEDDLETLIGVAHSFHIQVAELSGNSRGVVVISQLAEEVNRLMHLMPRLEENIKSADELSSHQDIVAAIEQQDSDKAALLMEEHLRDAGRAMAQAFIDGP
jgi:DNA-binding GntR family transcriptional regulator